MIGTEKSSTPQTEPLLIPPVEAAGLINISQATLWRHTATEKIPAPVKVGRKTFWRRAEILAWIDAGCPARKKWEAMRPRVLKSQPGRV
jgi:predicted DNA-binding transcriptional regulator AlpA